MSLWPVSLRGRKDSCGREIRPGGMQCHVMMRDGHTCAVLWEGTELAVPPQVQWCIQIHGPAARMLHTAELMQGLWNRRWQTEQWQ